MGDERQEAVDEIVQQYQKRVWQSLQRYGEPSDCKIRELVRDEIMELMAAAVDEAFEAFFES